MNPHDMLKLETAFQSPRRWGGVGLPGVRTDAVFNEGRLVSIPSEVGRGRTRQLDNGSMIVYPSVSIPSEVGRGRTRCDRRPATTRSSNVVSIPSEVGRGRTRSDARKRMSTKRRSPFQSPRRWGGVGLSGRCNDWPDMSLGSGFPYPPENGTKLGLLSLAPRSPGKRKRREQNRLRQVVTGARNRVNQGYEIRQSKKRRARPPRSGTGTPPGARRKPVTRRGPVHSPRNGASKAGGVREPRR